jgi:hypothetical protein
MVLNCEHVWKELSNYLEGALDPAAKSALEEHLKGCRHCTAIVDGTRNVLRLYADDLAFALPMGFDRRLHGRLDDEIEGRRGSAFGWVVSLAMGGLAFASLLMADVRDAGRPVLRSEHSQPARRAPEGTVAVAIQGKTFHVPGCTFLHGKSKLESSAEAIREGYSPCVRCMHEFLKSAGGNAPRNHVEQLAKEEMLEGGE